MITDKFNKDFSRGNKNISKLIEDVVADYFLKEKVTEESLRVLKQNVAHAVDEYRKNSQSEKASSKKPSQVSQQELRDRNAEDKKSQTSQKSKQSGVRPSNQSQKGSSAASSDASSIASKSVYCVDGDDDDEWATLVKFDTELFKKEKELEKIREQEFKKKMKKELDKQLDEKKRKKDYEKREENEYFDLQVEQAKIYDQREKEKKRRIREEGHAGKENERQASQGRKQTKETRTEERAAT